MKEASEQRVIKEEQKLRNSDDIEHGELLVLPEVEVGRGPVRVGSPRVVHEDIGKF